MEICGTSGLPILMVPRFHQSNGNIKRKLQAWRIQKCITLVGADTVLNVWYGMLYKAKNGNMWNFGPTNPHSTAFGPKKMVISKGGYGHGEFKNVLP